jgi:hypothetical protein
MDNTQPILSTDEISNPIKEKVVINKQKLTVPIMIGLGIVGMFLMVLMLFSLFQPKGTGVLPTPTPLPIKPLISPTKIPSPTPRKISTDSALRSIFDQEASIEAQINSMDFIEQKLVPPVLDLTITF